MPMQKVLLNLPMTSLVGAVIVVSFSLHRTRSFPVPPLIFFWKRADLEWSGSPTIVSGASSGMLHRLKGARSILYFGIFKAKSKEKTVDKVFHIEPDCKNDRDLFNDPMVMESLKTKKTGKARTHGHFGLGREGYQTQACVLILRLGDLKGRRFFRILFFLFLFFSPPPPLPSKLLLISIITEQLDCFTITQLYIHILCLYSFYIYIYNYTIMTFTSVNVKGASDGTQGKFTIHQ